MAPFPEEFTEYRSHRQRFLYRLYRRRPTCGFESMSTAGCFTLGLRRCWSSRPLKESVSLGLHHQYWHERCWAGREAVWL